MSPPESVVTAMIVIEPPVGNCTAFSYIFARSEYSEPGIESFEGIWSIRLDTMESASAYIVISVKSTRTLWFFSTAKYSAAVSDISGISRRSTAGSSVVFMKQMMRSRAPALEKRFLKYR